MYFHRVLGQFLGDFEVEFSEVNFDEEQVSFDVVAVVARVDAVPLPQERLHVLLLKYRTLSCKLPQGGLAAVCAKLVGGDLHEGGGFPVQCTCILHYF